MIGKRIVKSDETFISIRVEDSQVGSIKTVVDKFTGYKDASDKINGSSETLEEVYQVLESLKEAVSENK